MIKRILLGVLAASAIAGPLAAQEGVEYRAPTPFPRSVLTPRLVRIPPYDRPFRVRIYTTPQRQPYYNVPPCAVVTPY